MTVTAVHSTVDSLVPRWPSPVAALAHFGRVRGHRPWLTAVARSGEETVLTFGAADRATRAIAARLTAEFGSTPTTLALAPVNDIPSVLTVLGALRAGHRLLMLGPADPPERTSQQIAAAGAVAVLHTPGTTPPAGADAFHLADWREAPAGDLAARWTDPRLDAALDALYFATSGSTAASKLVAQSRLNATANAEAVRRHHRLSSGSRVLGCLPVHHVNGLHFSVLGTLMAGAQLVLADSFSPLTYPGLVERYRPHVASVVPSVLETLLEVWGRHRLPSGFRYFLTAAAPLPSATARAVADRIGTRVVQGYGLSETTNFSTTMPPGVSGPTYRELMLDAEIPSVGVALPGNEVAVLGPDGERLPAGEVGEVCMRGLNVMTRYLGNDEATSEAFRGGWFHSQDLGFRVEADNRDFFVLTGRVKNIAKVAGETVSLDEMDRALRALPQVRDAACVALPDRFAGERIVAAVVTTGDDGPEIATALRALFSEAVVPERFIALDRIPRTPTGKVLRPELRSLLQHREEQTAGRS
ncbi:Acyl-CoA synthetase (AMP-forming)/AMP-acid ligase II [Lentzea fradiae]|uniref:Acyl-CoA synthetase (AMP-forming)/AMP-acid ligase II n=1 Tax=Lentzea fradiae TaxID=200378 RepID=A0A1G7VJJ6_9PSEU|nr:fatty acid--CoA ligase family protein [Lentzea fradiae]SDG59903.1 Acyl-CoA synthetase (AMP-forming)/AMP-acid ligase II [Lentzea fradiae]